MASAATLAELPGSGPSDVLLEGRVVDGAEGTLTLLDATGARRVALAAPEEDAAAHVGAWVRLGARWTGEALEAGRVLEAHAPRAPWPKAGGDWAWLRDEAGRRLGHLRLRARLKDAVRAFFAEGDFLEVDTPAMVPSPGLDLHLDAFGVTGTDAPRWLITSPEYQLKRVLAGGVPRVYQLARCFRRSERGPLHEPEFTMVEWYRAFAGSEAVMADTEALVLRVAEAATGSAGLPGREGPVDVTPPWERLSVAEAFARHAQVSADAALAAGEETFFRVLATEIEPKLGRSRPVFLTGWPASMASLARLDTEGRADRFEAYVDGIELCNGFGELVDPVEQRTRLERDLRDRAAAKLPAYPIDERFLGALEEGLPPSGGNALGFDRLVMLAAGADCLADVLAVPAERL
ncbi:MAG: EF-P lysine aminoacylase EpmA [Myxococcota bacterium]